MQDISHNADGEAYLINVTVEDGKYTIRQVAPGKWECLKYGEPWPAFEGRSPDNLHMALANRVAELEAIFIRAVSGIDVQYEQFQAWLLAQQKNPVSAITKDVSDGVITLLEGRERAHAGFDPALGSEAMTGTDAVKTATTQPSDIEDMIKGLIAMRADRIVLVDDLPNRCGLDLPMNDVDDGEFLNVAELSIEDSGYGPALWRLALAMLKSRRASECGETAKPYAPVVDWSDWVEHDGKGMPVDTNARVMVRFRDGAVDAGGLCANFWHDDETSCSNWVHDGSAPDILAYRVVSE